MSRFRADLESLYGDRVRRVALSGSRAMILMLNPIMTLPSFWSRWSTDGLNWIVWPMSVSALPTKQGRSSTYCQFPSSAYGERTPPMREIRLDGVEF